MTKTEFISNIKKEEAFSLASSVRLYPKKNLFDETSWEVSLCINKAVYTKELTNPLDYKKSMVEISIFIENSYTRHEITLRRIIMRDINICFTAK